MLYKTTHHNLKDVQGLLSRFIAESVYAVSVAEGRLPVLLGHKDILTVVVYDDSGEPCGLFMGFYNLHPIFESAVAQDLVLYVTPERRSGLIAARLVKIFESWAKAKDVNYIMLGQSTGIGDMERVRGFFERLGFQTTGFNAMKGL